MGLHKSVTIETGEQTQFTLEDIRDFITAIAQVGGTVESVINVLPSEDGAAYRLAFTETDTSE